MHQEAISYESFIDEDVNGIPIEFLQLGLGIKAGQAKGAGIAFFLVGIPLPGRRLG
jgi:hypothetical protein